MDSEQFARVCEVFEKACAVPEAQRPALVDELCRQDPELRTKVLALIERDQRLTEDGGISGIKEDLGRLAGDALESKQSWPARIGGYRVIGELGRGGMGVVYRAEQENPQREVALKVIRPGLVGGKLLRRFAHEAALLGRLQHAGIAQIFEAGTEGTGEDAQPFFAMELVRGREITRYVEEENLDLRQRLQLIVDLCDAVQHAHQNGIIHRDLKPGNVLVSENGQPKILDFGVARQTDRDLRVTTIHTDPGQLVGTLQYMSPEQIAGDGQDIDTRSDVYALGVVAYELLSGKLPHERGAQSLPQAARAILEEEPVLLGALDPYLRGDIETIIGKALEKDRDRRYQTARELRDDVLRFLNHEPIEARPPSTIYQLKKFARRNTGLVAGLLTAVGILIAAVVVMIFLTMRAREAEQKAHKLAQQQESLRIEAEEARDAADRRERIAVAVNEFLDRMLSAPDPWAVAFAGDLDVKVASVLDQAAQELDEGFDGLPDVEAQIRGTLGRTYKNLGYFHKARDQWKKALASNQANRGDDAIETLDSLRAFGEILTELGEFQEAETISRQALEGHRRVYGERHSKTLFAAFAVGNLLFHMNRFEEALELSQRNYETCLKEFGKNSQQTQRSATNYGVVLLNVGHLDEAEDLLRETIESCTSLYGKDHPETLGAMSNLSAVLWRKHRIGDAEQVAREVHTMRVDVLGEDHPQTLNSLNSVIVFLSEQGRSDEAIRLREKQLDLARSRVGDEHPLVLSFKHNFASALHKRRRLPKAEALCREVVEARKKILPPGHEQTLLTLELLAAILKSQHRFDEAASAMEEAVDLADESLAPDHWRTAWFRTEYATLLTTLKRFEEAEYLLEDSYAMLEEIFGPDDSRTRTAAKQWMRLYEKWGHPEKAEELRFLIQGE